MKIAITGIGIISAIGNDQRQIVDALLHEQTGVGTMHYLHSKHTELPVGEVKMSNEELRQKLSISSSEAISRTALLGLHASREALHQAKITDVSEMAFISGTTVGGMDTTERFWSDWQKNKNLDYVSQHEAGATTKTIAQHIGSFAYLMTPSTACSSALNAMIMGANLLRAGKVKKALVGGTESLTCFHLNGFHSLMILDKELCRPFDKDRAGLNLGEGAAYVVLESEQEALARGATILGYVAGYANACDAFHQTASSEEGEGAFLAMQQALQMANIEPQAVDYINAHGTGTANNDASESRAIKRLFGEKLPAISSTKAFTGHTTSASGAIETAICLLCMQKGFVPANLHYQQGDENVIKPVQKTQFQPLQTVLCNSFGFGGNDSALVLSQKGVDLADKITDFTLQEYVCVVDDLDDYKGYIPPMVARRMTPQTRKMMVAMKKVVQESGIEPAKIEAIFCATHLGNIEQTAAFLEAMLNENEQNLPPTLFMNSTHNTVASQVAIELKNHHYNITYSDGEKSLESALLDMKTQLELGLIQNALVLEFDTCEPKFDAMLQKVGKSSKNMAKAYIYCKK